MVKPTPQNNTTWFELCTYVNQPVLPALHVLLENNNVTLSLERFDLFHMLNIFSALGINLHRNKKTHAKTEHDGSPIFIE